METPLSPLEFLRRTRRLYPDREAVIDVPKSFTFVTELPKTATGKIQKFVLRSGKAAIVAQLICLHHHEQNQGI